MNWIRAGAIFTAFGVHAAALTAFGVASESQSQFSALQSASGKDDMTAVATVTLQSEETIGFDFMTAERQDASAGAASPQAEHKSETPAKAKTPEVEEVAAPKLPEFAPAVNAASPATEAKTLTQTAKAGTAQPPNPAALSAPEEEQRAASRDLEARRSELLSLYNSKIYQAVVRHALRPKKPQAGRVVVELTLAPSGQLLTHRVVQSSGSTLLDRTALANLEHAAPFPPAPGEWGNEPYKLTIPFEYAIK